MHHSQGQDQWVKSLQQYAARLAFPDWQPGPDDWANLYTGFDQDGTPYTEVAVYRGHDRIHHTTYNGDELMAFWTRLLNEVND